MPFNETLSTAHEEYPNTLKNYTVMQDYKVSGYDAIDYICMSGALWDKGYIMCLHRYHYVSV